MLVWLPPALLVLFAKESAVAATEYVEDLYWPHGNVENGEGINGMYELNTKSRYNLLGRLFAAGKYVVITFPRIFIEGYEGKRCENDWLALYTENQASQLKGICDPSNRLVPSLGVFCNYNEPPALLGLPGQNITIEFCSDQVIEDAGFEFKWKTVLSPPPTPTPPKPKFPVIKKCGDTFVMGPNQERVIYSPGFEQGMYPSNVRCKWTIKGAGTVFLLESQHFELEDDEGHKCLPDRLTVSVQSEDEPASFGPYCGRQAPEILIRPKNAYVVTIEFSSDSKISWSGFKLLLRTAFPKPSICGRTTYMQSDKTSVSFYTPDYPAFNRQNKVCTFTVKRKAYTRYNAFEVRFNDFNLNTSSSYLMISSGDRSDTFSGMMNSNLSFIYAGPFKLQLKYSAKGDSKIGDRIQAEIRLLTLNPLPCSDDAFHCSSGQCVALEKFCNGIWDCKDGSDEMNELCHHDNSIARKSCGFSAVQPNMDTILDFNQYALEAKAHSWPWSAAIIRKGQKGDEPVCYATLISRRWLLTSASCMETNSNYNAYVVRLGSSQLNSSGDLFEIDYAIKHPQFDRKDKNNLAQNDLMLLKLSQHAKFSKTIMPVCLPPTKFFLRDNAYCMALGWMDADKRGERLAMEKLQRLLVCARRHVDAKMPILFAKGVRTRDEILEVHL
ncbi:Ldl recept a and CUB and Trypsin domain containin g protein [Trichuris trichiura]|uniref:Ldl recept a and CUB and Trypsin domain containin g protein n=1 Tax=Trichuris trichiura TaxID=36087 RepID=A0A077ZDJ0_TRITR|nr:Ldl recept a and CUB and Trypsin domain containin g protein [Trichuris trichiura]